MEDRSEPQVATSSRGPAWARQLDDSTFSFAESIGGWRGALESLLPGLIFVVAYVVTKGLWWPLVLSGGTAALFVLIRILQRSTLTQAFAGVFGVLIGVAWAGLSGKAENYFAWGLLTNAFFLLLMLVSLLVRRPAMLLLMQFAVGLPDGWKDQPWAPLLRKRTALATWVWVAVFGLRLGVQAPLYFGGQVVGLGVLKLLMGLPLFAIGGWLTWVLLRRVVPASAEEND